MGTDNDRDLVRRGYDAISHAYRNDEGQRSATSEEDMARYRGWVDELATLIEPRARVLDLGCGSGLPATKLLVEKGFQVVGLDFSQVQIERARHLVSRATFVQADMVEWDAEPASFDAVVSLYALIHVPLEDQIALFPRIRRWLRPGGFLLAIVGHQRWTGVEEWLGAPMFWDHTDAATYLDCLDQAGLRPVWNRYVPEGDAGHVLVLAQAPLGMETTPTS